MFVFRLSLLALCVACAGTVQAALGPAKSAATTGTPAHLTLFGAVTAGQRRAAGLERLDGALAEVSLRYPAVAGGDAMSSLHALNPAARFRLAPPLAVPEVAIDAVTSGDVQALRSALESLGLEHASVYSNDVGGWLPVDRLAEAAALAGLHHIRAAMPRTRTGAVTTQGDFVIASAAIRSNFPNLDGSGVIVGALSDSFDCYSVYASNGVPQSGNQGYASNGFPATYANDQTSGDLPANVNVLDEPFNGNCLNYGAPTQTPFGDEGRAILQIIHDIAPGAGLAFHTAINSEADFANGIVALASNSVGAKVIDDDVGYPDEPYFQDGIVAQAVDQVESQGVAYFSSAGNDGANSYENTSPSFVISGTGAQSGEKLLSFNTSGTAVTSLPVTIPPIDPGVFISLVLQWDQPYVTGAPTSGGAQNKLDLCVSGNSGAQLVACRGDSCTTVTACTGLNNPGDDPYQILVIGNPANASGSTPTENLSISIGLHNGDTVPGRVKFVAADNGYGAQISPTYATNSPTLQGHPGAAGAAAVGAAPFYNTPACNNQPATLETFSSLGGDPILFAVNGNRLGTPILRQKPDFTGPDGVNDTFLGVPPNQLPTIPNGYPSACKYKSFPGFFGTSAAAPHAAAAAALFLQANPADTPSQIYAAFRSTASAMGGSSGYHFDSGFGFMQADMALASLPPGPPFISVNPTTITAGGSSTLSWSEASASSCTASNAWSGSKSTSGSQMVSPSTAGSYTYTLTCTNGTVTSPASSATLTVNSAGTTTGGGGGGSGGGFDGAALLGLAAFAAWRRRRSKD